MFLDTLCQEYTSVYYVDLDAGVGEIIKIDSGANAAKFIYYRAENPIRRVGWG